jgi:hypothetical protein
LVKNIKIIGLVLVEILIIGSVGVFLWINALHIKQHPVEKTFLVPWLGMQTFLQFGTDPYSEPSNQRVQIAYYGRLAEKNQDPLKLNQPFASVLLYFPFALISDYATARVVWMTLLELSLIGLALLCPYLFEWKIPLPVAGLYTLFAILGAQALIPLSENSPIILISLLLVGGLISLRSGMDELAGAAFAIVAFQPAVTGIFLIFTIIWVIKNHRWRVIWSGLMTLGFLFVSSFALLPGWFLPFIRSVRTEINFMNYQSTYGLLSKLWPAIGTKVAIFITIGIVILVVFEWRRIPSGDFRWYLWAASLSLAIITFIGFPILVLNYFIFLIPLTYFLVILSERMSEKKRWVNIGLLLGLIFTCLWVGDYGLRKVNNDLTVDLICTFIPPLFMIIGLYWIRWWVIHPLRTPLEVLKSELK